MKRVLITAGATTVPIDKVRAITNIFKGRTGTEIAEFFSKKGCQVILLTSNPELVKDKSIQAISSTSVLQSFILE